MYTHTCVYIIIIIRVCISSSIMLTHSKPFYISTQVFSFAVSQILNVYSEFQHSNFDEKKKFNGKIMQTKKQTEFNLNSRYY